MRQKRKSSFKPKDISLTIESIGAGGDGIGTFEGKPVYVPKTMASEQITARLESGGTDGYKARLLDILTPSAQRVTPPCQYFAKCGGCDLQHLEENAYRDWKIEKVKTILERAGVKPKEWKEPVFIPAGTRRRTTLAVLKTGNSVHIGYHEPRSHTIVSVKSCPILDPALEKIINGMKPFLLRLAPQRKAVTVTLQVAGGIDVMLGGEWRERGSFTLEQNEALAEMAHSLDLARIGLREKETDESEILLSRTPIRKTFGALSVALPPVPFLQASDAGEKALVNAVLNYAADSKNVADLFCGCGTFAGSLLKNGAQVLAVDSDKEAVAALAAIKHLNLSTQAKNLFKEPLSVMELNGYDTVVFDPPRAGAKEQVSLLADSNVERIIAVSCNPATFARDARILMDEGDYRLRSLQIIDQFVWSSHVELVGLFTRR